MTVTTAGAATSFSTENLSPAVAETSRQHLTVLLIDESDAQRDRLGRMLRQVYGQRVEIRQADEGSRALELLERVSVDLVLLDSRLPDIDALELLSQIAEVSDHTAVIFMSAQGSERLAAQSIQGGAAEYAIKHELTPVSLKRMITRSLNTARLERRNAQIIEQMRRSHGEMDHFMRAVSHDMGANLKVLEQSLRRLKKSVSDAPLKNLTEGFSHVEASLQESRRFLEDLARLSQAASQPTQPQRVELPEVIREVLREQDALLRQRGIQVELDEPLPAVCCDPQCLKQVLGELIGYTALHGCARDPRIVVSQIAPPPGAPAGHVWLRVYDNGPPIPALWHEEMFMPGRKIPGTTAAGSGMGLAIAKKIIEQYRGTIELDQRCEDGTALVFSLPAAAAE